MTWYPLYRTPGVPQDRSERVQKIFPVVSLWVWDPEVT